MTADTRAWSAEAQQAANDDSGRWQCDLCGEVIHGDDWEEHRLQCILGVSGEEDSWTHPNDGIVDHWALIIPTSEDQLDLAGYIVHTDNDGHFYLHAVYTRAASARTYWEMLVEDLREEGGPLEEDITTEDYQTFWYYGGIAFTVEDGQTWQQALTAYTEGGHYFPDVWYIDDHGGHTLLKDTY